MNQVTKYLQNGITSGMEQKNAMALDKSTDMLNPSNEDHNVATSVATASKRNNGLTSLASPASTEPKILSRDTATGKLNKSNFISRLSDYPLNKSFKGAYGKPHLDKISDSALNQQIVNKIPGTVQNRLTLIPNSTQNWQTPDKKPDSSQIRPTFDTIPSSSQIRPTFDTVLSSSQIRPTFDTIISNSQIRPTFDTIPESSQIRPTFDTIPESSQIRPTFDTIPESSQIRPTFDTIPESSQIRPTFDTIPESSQIRQTFDAVPDSPKINTTYDEKQDNRSKIRSSSEKIQDNSQIRPTTNEKPESSKVLPTSGEKPDISQIRPTSDKKPERSQIRPTFDEKPEISQIRPTSDEKPDSSQIRPTSDEKPDSSQIRPTSDEKPDSSQIRPTSYNKPEGSQIRSTSDIPPNISQSPQTSSPKKEKHKTSTDKLLNDNASKLPEKETPGRTAASLIDAPLASLPSNDPPQQTFVLRKINSPENPINNDPYRWLSFRDGIPLSKINSPEIRFNDDPYRSLSLRDGVQPRKLGSLPKQGDTTSSQILNSSYDLNSDSDWNSPRFPGNNLMPRELGSVKARSELALSTLNPTDQTLDPRRNSSQNNLAVPESLISSNPRRDSAWTAEVLSIEIQVDYVMDPEELWGQSKKPSQDDMNNTETVVLTLDSIPPPDTDDIDHKSEPVDEVGVVIPVVTLTPDDGGGDDDDKRSESSVENGVPPEKTEPIKDPHRSLDSFDLNLPPREHWGNRGQFLLSTIGYAVDLSNVWRFPFLCYKNGGGAFLIPYFITLIFGAMPVFFMEMCLGQFNRCGPTAIWEKMSPMFKGIGMASCFMAYIVGFYYNVIIAWSFFYLFASFTPKLPWTTCFNNFNSENCWQIDWDTNTTTNSTSKTSEASEIVSVSKDHGSTRPVNRTYNVSVSVSATIEYFERGMLELNHSNGLNDLGAVKWQLVLYTLLTFTVLYFCLWKGVKSTGKVVYITATLPYVVMTILLVRGVLLPGAGVGIRYFITPKIDSLQRPKVWIDAAVQIFFSVGTGFGTHIAYASYNKFHSNCKRDCIITVAVNSFTSIFSGVVIFSYLGFLSLKTQKDIDKVATEGPGLVFIVYPEAIATLPGSMFWAIIFFFMLLALGLDSAFGGLESPLTGIRDEFSQLIKYKYFREVITLIVIVSAFLFSIPCVLQGGVYVFTILDTFAAGTSIVFIVLCEVVAVSWFYGTPQFCADVEKMIGEKPSMFWRVCWKFVCPILLTVIVISSIISFQPLTYRSSQGIYTFPSYANIIGWCIACSSMFMVPGYIIYRLIRNKGSCSQRLALAISPQCEHEEIIQTKVVKRFQRQHWLSI